MPNDGGRRTRRGISPARARIRSPRRTGRSEPIDAGEAPYGSSSSAICTALSAAPLRI